jgi:pilus assembly protein CpaE
MIDAMSEAGAAAQQLPMPSTAFGDPAAIAEGVKAYLLENPDIDGALTIGAGEADAAAVGIAQSGKAGQVLLGSPQKVGTSEITVFINAKGGSGASFLAANIAHLLAAASNRRTVLLDLDLQLGNLPQYFDLKPKRGLAEALEAANDLDSVAIDAYLTAHESGLAVLAAQNIGVDLHHELEGFETVVGLLMDKYERIIVDVHKHVEPFSALMLERAHKIVLVMQQSVPSVHDAVRMHDILTKDLAVPADRITVVVNRFHKTASIQLADIEQSLNGKRPVSIPNDFQTVSESVDIGVPMYDHARRSPVTKALIQLEEFIDGRPAATPKGLIARLRGAAG